MTRSLAPYKQRLLTLPLAQLMKVAGDFLKPPDVPPLRQRLFTPWLTFWLFLSQVLSAAPTCREALRHAQVWLRGTRKAMPSSNTSAYCQARVRLPKAHLDQAFEGSRDHLAAHEPPSAIGRPVRLIDGSSCSMPDTPQNQGRYPQPRGQKAGCGFPVMRFVALFALSSGAILGAAKGPLRTPERTLWRRLWRLFNPGDIALADRGFCSFADYVLLLRRGVDSVMRLHARREKGVRKIERLGKDDWLVDWVKTKLRPKWMSRLLWNGLPDTLRVRHITVHIDIPGFRTKTLFIATTLLDHRAYPPSVLADLYRQRWMAELFLRDIKIAMGMDVLRCKTPELIQKEFTMHLIAYNLVRALMLQAAMHYNKAPLRLSLTGAIATVRQGAPALAAVQSRHSQRRMLHDLLRCLASDLIPHRPNRIEPRARKRRPKNYRLLIIPRALFKETYYQHQYEKSLS